MLAVLERPLNNKENKYIVDNLQLLFHLLDVLYCVSASRLEMLTDV